MALLTKSDDSLEKTARILMADGMIAGTRALEEYLRKERETPKGCK